MLLSIIAFVLVLSLLVFIHELGHFLVAKWTGMRVDEFAIGFPPRLFAVKKGETTYALNALPLGGYVKIYGENGHADEEGEPRSFHHKPAWARALVLVAGVSMNLLFAFVVLCIAYTSGFPSIAPGVEAIPGATVTDGRVLVAEAIADSPAQRAGIVTGDALRSFSDPLDGSTAEVKTVGELQAVTSAKQKEGHFNLTVSVDREGATLMVPVTLSVEGPPLGVQVVDATSVRVPFYRSPQAAVQVIGVIGGSTWSALKDFGRELFQAKLDEQISGPVGIYRATSSAVQEGFASVVFLSVALSINLALLNILPIPVLDGGKLLFVAIEAVFRKKVIAMEIENGISTVAFFLIIGLISVITLKDLGLF